MLVLQKGSVSDRVSSVGGRRERRGGRESATPTFGQPVIFRPAPQPTNPKPSLPARAAAAAVALLIAAAPAPAFAGDVVLGAKVFSNTCAACHAGGQNIVEADKTLEKEALETYLAGGFSEASIVKQASGGEEEGGNRGGGGGAHPPFTTTPARRASRAAARLARAPLLTAPPRAWAPVLRVDGKRGRERSREGEGGKRFALSHTHTPTHR